MKTQEREVHVDMIPHVPNPGYFSEQPIDLLLRCYQEAELPPSLKRDVELLLYSRGVYPDSHVWVR